MDFLGLFDPASSDELVDSGDDFSEQLPPEPQVGNVEYKLKLVSPSKQRFEHLVTQVRTDLIDSFVSFKWLKYTVVKQFKLRCRKKICIIFNLFCIGLKIILKLM